MVEKITFKLKFDELQVMCQACQALASQGGNTTYLKLVSANAAVIAKKLSPKLVIKKKEIQFSLNTAEALGFLIVFQDKNIIGSFQDEFIQSTLLSITAHIHQKTI